MSVRNGHRRRIGFVEIALADSVREPARPAALGFEIDRLTQSERAELGAVLESAFDLAAGVLDWRRVDPWTRFRFVGLCDRAAVENGYDGHRLGMAGLTETEHAFRSSTTATVNRGFPWLRYWLFPEVERPDDLPPFNAEQAASEYWQREGRRIEAEQAAWDAARQMEAEDRAKAGHR